MNSISQLFSSPLFSAIQVFLLFHILFAFSHCLTHPCTLSLYLSSYQSPRLFSHSALLPPSLSYFSHSTLLPPSLQRLKDFKEIFFMLCCLSLCVCWCVRVCMCVLCVFLSLHKIFNEVPSISAPPPEMFHFSIFFFFFFFVSFLK